MWIKLKKEQREGFFEQKYYRVIKDKNQYNCYKIYNPDRDGDEYVSEKRIERVLTDLEMKVVEYVD